MTVHRTNHPAIVATGLGKRYGESEPPCRYRSRRPRRHRLGLLGPNGAGKTTRPHPHHAAETRRGQAPVAGIDVSPSRRRARAIGLTGQYATVDELLTGRRTW